MPALGSFGVRMFQREGTTSAKALRREHVCVFKERKVPGVLGQQSCWGMVEVGRSSPLELGKEFGFYSENSLLDRP